MSTDLNVFEKIIDKRLRVEIEDTLHQAERGFCKGRSIEDHIRTVKQLMENLIHQIL